MSQSEMGVQPQNNLSPEERMALKEKYERKASFWMKIVKFLVSPLPMILLLLIMNIIAIPFMVIATITVIAQNPNVSNTQLTTLTNDLFNSKYVLPTYCIYGIIGFIIFGLWYALAFVRKDPKKFNPLESISFSSILMVIGSALGAFGIVEVFMVLLSMIAPKIVLDYAARIENSGIIGFDGIIPILCMYVIAPVVEELAIRGVSRKLLKWAGLGTIAILFWQAVYFGIMHMDPVQSSYTFFVGLILGYIAIRYDSIYLSILAHLAFNVIGTVTPELFTKFEVSDTIQISVFVCCILIFAVTILMDRLLKKSDIWSKPFMQLIRKEKEMPKEVFPEL